MIIWLTDLHFNFIPSFKSEDFLYLLQHKKPEGIIISGDIAANNRTFYYLNLIKSYVNAPIYFVLGNHDFYGSSFEDMKKNASNLGEGFHYLTNEDVLELNPMVGLVGDDGWYDARWRDPITNIVFLADFLRINNFFFLSQQEKLALCREMALVSVQNVRKKLSKAFKKYDKVYFVTHFPPWPDNSSIFSTFWRPYNSSKIMADMLLDLMKDLNNKDLIILSGHNHKYRDERITSNIRLKTGGVRVLFPKIHEVIYL